MVDHERLTGMLVEFATTLVSDYHATDILDKLCGAVADVLPATGAGVMLADEEGHLRFVAASDEVVRTIETLQIELGARLFSRLDLLRLADRRDGGDPAKAGEPIGRQQPGRKFFDDGGLRPAGRSRSLSRMIEKSGPL